MSEEETKTLSETINDDLSATFDEMAQEITEANKKEADEDALPGKEEEVKEGKEKIEEKGKPSDKPSSEEEPGSDEKKSDEEEEEELEEETSLETGDLEPNSGWDKETQDGFKQLPHDMQEFMLKRHHEMQADYTRKTKDVADIKRALEPARELIDKLNISDGEAIKNLVGAHMLLQTKPLVGIQYLMQAYKISLGDVTENWQDDESFTQTVNESSRINRIESELDERTREQQETLVAQAQAEIDVFKVDHPHYDKVEKQMIRLTRLALVSGEAKPTLESLYEQAIKLDPEIVAMTKEKPPSGKDVKQAKKAATRIKGTPKKEEKETVKPASIKDELSQGWDKAAGA